MKLGDRAKVLVDLGHHLHGTNIEQIVAIAARRGAPRRLPLQQPQVRRRRPDRRLRQPVRAVPDLLRARRSTLPRLTIDQAHNVEAKVEAMVLSVVNLQEAYAKALLVDREALAAAQADGDVLRGHELLLDAYRTDVRPLCAGSARVARRGRGPGRRACGRYAERIDRRARYHRRRCRGVGPMSDAGADRSRPPRTAGRPRPRCRTTRSARCCSPRTCSAPTARWRTSAAATRRPRATATDHVGREVDVMWVKGSGSDLATMEREHFTPLRLDEMLPLFERDEMSDEDMVAHLARCQIDPAAPRSSIETLLHAFVPADARPPHAPRRDQRARRHARRRGAGRRVLRRRGRLDPVHPARASRSPSRSATAVRENPGLKLVVLAKHGLVVWGDTRRGGLPAHDRGRSTGRPTSSTRARRATRDSAAPPRGETTGAATCS